jgi:hypothetical protein
MGSYDSRHYGYVADAMNLGQVQHDGTRVPTTIAGHNRVEVHGSMRRSGAICIELCFVVDMNLEDLPDNVLETLSFGEDSAPMTMRTVLGDQASGHVFPPIILLPMPPRPANYNEGMRAAVLDSPAVSQCMHLRCSRQAVSRGRESATTQPNAQIEFLIHELNMAQFPYPGEVYEYILARLAALGISRDRISARYHLNIHEDEWTAPKVATEQASIVAEIMEHAPPDSQQVDATPDSLAAPALKRLNHRLHYDPSKTYADADEMKTRRGVFTMELECTEEEAHALKSRMTQQQDDIPQKTGDPSFAYEAIVGKANYRWETYISNGKQAAIARGLHEAFAAVCSADGL